MWDKRLTEKAFQMPIKKNFEPKIRDYSKNEIYLTDPVYIVNTDYYKQMQTLVTAYEADLSINGLFEKMTRLLVNISSDHEYFSGENAATQYQLLKLRLEQIFFLVFIEETIDQALIDDAIETLDAQLEQCGTGLINSLNKIYHTLVCDDGFAKINLELREAILNEYVTEYSVQHSIVSESRMHVKAILEKYAHEINFLTNYDTPKINTNDLILAKMTKDEIPKEIEQFKKKLYETYTLRFLIDAHTQTLTEKIKNAETMEDGVEKLNKFTEILKPFMRYKIIANLHEALEETLEESSTKLKEDFKNKLDQYMGMLFTAKQIAIAPEKAPTFEKETAVEKKPELPYRFYKHIPDEDNRTSNLHKKRRHVHDNSTTNSGTRK